MSTCLGRQCCFQKTWVAKEEYQCFGRSIFRWVIDQGSPRGLQNNASYYQDSWLSSITWWEGPIVEDTTHISCFRTQRNRFGNDLEASFLLASFHGVIRYHTGHYGRRHQGWIIYAIISTCQVRYTHWYTKGMTVGEETICFLIGFDACSTGGNSHQTS